VLVNRLISLLAVVEAVLQQWVKQHMELTTAALAALELQIQ
jgi:hypothetical protein